MACNKYQLINTGTTNAYITFRRCEDGAYERNYECIPYRIYNLWVMDDTLTSAEMSQLSLEYEGTFPPPAPAPGITLNFDVSSGSETIYFSSNDTVTMKVSWGDGTFDEITDSSYELYHTYSPGQYTAIVQFSDNTLVDDFEVYDSNLVSTSDNFIIFPNLVYLYLDNNYLSTFAPSSLPSSLTDLGVYDNNLTSFSLGITLPSSLCYIDYDYNLLSCSALTESLVYLDSQTLPCLPEIYTYGQDGCGCDSDQAAYDAVTSMQNKNWYVEADLC